MTTVRLSMPGDFAGWLMLAKEVEPLFGPMVGESSFREAVRRAILGKSAFCASGSQGKGRPVIRGGIVISKEANRVLWLAVFRGSRGRGVGKALLSEAVAHLDRGRPIAVTTFDGTVEAGLAARKLYRAFGFCDDAAAGTNPAGIPTVTMVLPALPAR